MYNLISAFRIEIDVFRDELFNLHSAAATMYEPRLLPWRPKKQ